VTALAVAAVEYCAAANAIVVAAPVVVTAVCELGLPESLQAATAMTAVPKKRLLANGLNFNVHSSEQKSGADE